MFRTREAAPALEMAPGRRFSQFAAEVRSQGEQDGAPRVEFVISTGDVARDNMTLNPEGWRLDNYRKNPVVMWAHRYGEPPVGTSLREWVQDRGLRSEAQFTPRDLYPFGHTIGRMYQEGVLRAVSVGWDIVPGAVAWNEKRGGLDVLAQELWEYSAVPIPADPNALAVASARKIDLAPYRTWLEQALDEEGFVRVPREHLERLHRAAGAGALAVDMGRIRALEHEFRSLMREMEREAEPAPAGDPPVEAPAAVADDADPVVLEVLDDDPVVLEVVEG